MTSSILTLINFTLVGIAVMYFLTRSRRIVSFLLKEKKTRRSCLLCILLFALPVTLSSEFGLPVMGVTTNLRTSIVFFSAVVGGPVCCLVIGALGSLYRLTLGGWTGLACAAATLCGSFLASLVVYKKKIYPGKLNPKSIGLLTLLVFIWENIHVLVFIPILSGRPFIETVYFLLHWIYLPQTLINTFSMLIFCFLLMDLVTLDTRILSEKQHQWLQKTFNFAHHLEIKVEERTKELAEANKTLFESSIRDPLTSIYNRKYLQQVILEENAKLAKGCYQFYAALCIDLDNFKLYNDHYGHLAGDIILQEFANTLRTEIKDTGLIFRTGGDEFAVLLPNIDTENAIFLAQKIIFRLEEANSFKQKVEAVLQEKIEEPENLSCSIGIQTFLNSPVPDSIVPATADLNRLLYLADKHLLQAKTMGKNQYSLS